MFCALVYTHFGAVMTQGGGDVPQGALPTIALLLLGHAAFVFRLRFRRTTALCVAITVATLSLLAAFVRPAALATASAAFVIATAIVAALAAHFRESVGRQVNGLQRRLAAASARLDDSLRAALPPPVAQAVRQGRDARHERHSSAAVVRVGGFTWSPTQPRGLTARSHCALR